MSLRENVPDTFNSPPPEPAGITTDAVPFGKLRAGSEHRPSGRLRLRGKKNSCSGTPEISLKTPICKKKTAFFGFLSSIFGPRQSPLFIEGQNMCDMATWSGFWPDAVVSDREDGYNNTKRHP